MSTFKGLVKEFPEIRIDFFRRHTDRPPPLACFLSHIHSDHLQGLESFRSPFIYCSAATRELLLRLEKFPHRLNLAKGILETRKVQYKSLKTLLRPIPLRTPTRIELRPGRWIYVTLFDANHCPGAVMFLIEDDDHAILYTGDIRAEKVWVDMLAQEPILVPYTTGLKKLDCIYLDTTFATHEVIHRSFPTKREGIADLLAQVSKYPKDTKFHINTWTFGYENALIALAHHCRSKIHADDYKLHLFRSLKETPSSEGYALSGFPFGNGQHDGILTDDVSARIHTCERGLMCATARAKNTVQIIPIIARTPEGGEVSELGAGGGLGDLAQRHEFMLDNMEVAMQLMTICGRIEDAEVRARAMDIINSAAKSVDRTLLMAHSEVFRRKNDIPIEEVVGLIEDLARASEGEELRRRGLATRKGKESVRPDGLPSRITFPFSRHSSYSELVYFLKLFYTARDVYPCVVDESKWTPAMSMSHLFGHVVPAERFSHDEEMLEKYDDREIDVGGETQRTSTTESQLQLALPYEDEDSPSPLKLKRKRVIASSPRHFEFHAAKIHRGDPTQTPPRTQSQRQSQNQEHDEDGEKDSQTSSERAHRTRLRRIREHFEKMQPAQMNISRARTAPDSSSTFTSSNLNQNVPLPLVVHDEHPRSGSEPSAHSHPDPIDAGKLSMSSPTHPRRSRSTKLLEPSTLTHVTETSPLVLATTSSEAHHPVPEEHVEEEEKDDSQISFSDSVFASQDEHGAITTSEAAMARRKEAYLLARKAEGAGWLSKSLVSVSVPVSFS